MQLYLNRLLKFPSVLKKEISGIRKLTDILQYGKKHVLMTTTMDIYIISICMTSQPALGLPISIIKGTYYMGCTEIDEKWIVWNDYRDGNSNIYILELPANPFAVFINTLFLSMFEVEKCLSSQRSGQTPDLLIERFGTLYDKATRQISAAITIKNQGSQAADKCMVAYFLCSELVDSPFSADATDAVLLLTDTVSGLPAGESRAGKTTKQFSIPPTATRGTWYFGAMVDSGDVIAESNEGNNIVYSNEVVVLS